MLISGAVTLSQYGAMELLGIGLYFFVAAYCMASGCRWIVYRLREQFHTGSPYRKIAVLGTASAVYAGVISLLFAFGWLGLSKEGNASAFAWKAVLIAAVLATGLAWVYEILLLTQERVLDSKIVDELDKERISAELHTLKNELDPHFMLNSLVTLSHLIGTSPERAALFNARLAEVYKYILQNRNRELVTLEKEIEFIEDYMFLLQIRHDNKLQLELQVDTESRFKSMLVPCSLQTLVENAIKHNHFTDAKPLHIKVQLNGRYIKISNNTSIKPYLVESTSVGLKNLSNRYRLTCNKDIVIERGQESFTVKLPLISNQ